VIDSFEEADEYPEATAAEFRTNDEDIAQCISRKLFVELLDFDVGLLRNKLTTLEVSIEKNLWELLNKLSKDKLSS